METSVNNKCKAFTSLEQSKKLAEILPLESADMIWVLANPDLPMIKAIAYEDSEKSKYYEILPAWSLAALLSILPFHLIIDNQRYEFSMKKGLDKNGEIYAIKYAIFNMTFYFHLTNYYNNPVDACVEMILKLKEMNLI